MEALSVQCLDPFWHKATAVSDLIASETAVATARRQFLKAWIQRMRSVTSDCTGFPQCRAAIEVRQSWGWKANDFGSHVRDLDKLISVCNRKRLKETDAAVREERFDYATVEKKKKLGADPETAQTAEHVQPLLTLLLYHNGMFFESQFLVNNVIV